MTTQILKYGLGNVTEPHACMLLEHVHVAPVTPWYIPSILPIELHHSQ